MTQPVMEKYNNTVCYGELQGYRLLWRSTMTQSVMGKYNDTVCYGEVQRHSLLPCSTCEEGMSEQASF